MRALALLAVLLAALVAGCAAPKDGPKADPLFGLCPQWTQGHGEQVGSLALGGGAPDQAERVLDAAQPRYLDRPLDLYRVIITDLNVTGDLEMRAHSANGTRLSVRDYRLEDTQMVPVVRLDPSAVGKEFDVFLSPVLEDGPVEETPATLQWTLDGEAAQVGYKVTFHYKVCGL